MKKVKGLAGTKCALEHSKTMYSTGGSMIKPKYEMGGMTDSCSVDMMNDPGKGKSKTKKRGCSTTTKSKGPKKEFNPLPNRYTG